MLVSVVRTRWSRDSFGAVRIESVSNSREGSKRKAAASSKTSEHLIVFGPNGFEKLRGVTEVWFFQEIVGEDVARNSFQVSSDIALPGL
jgi:hypothetical protein